MNKVKQYRQGDVLMIEVNSIPENVKPIKSRTLALGEVTGHHHTFDNGATCFADDEEASLGQYFESSGATITHQEHNPISVPSGKYRSIIQSEYSPEAIRNVAD